MVVTTIQKKLTTNRNVGGNRKEYIVIHDVGIPGQTAKNNVDYFAREKVNASAHYFVDRTSIWQSVEDNDIAWHVGDGKGKYGIYNRDCLGIEMIVEKDGTIHPQTKENTKWLVKQLQSKYKIPNNKIIRHYDASRKNCPQFLNRDGKWTEWHEFYQYLIGEDGLTVKQYEELKQLIDKQAKQIEQLKVSYNKDEAPDAWAKDDIEFAKSNGITDGTYLKRPITRQEAIVLVVRGIKHLKAYVQSLLNLK